MLMRIQKIVGIGMLVFSAILILFSVKFDEGDATFTLMSIPLGIYMIFTKKRLLDMDQDDEEFFK